MNLELLNTYFSDVYLGVILSIILGLISFILIYCFKRLHNQSCEDYLIGQQLSVLKKKSKKKVNPLKLEKSAESSENQSSDRRPDSKHIEIKNSPEIIDDDVEKDFVINPSLVPGKPILRKTEEDILISDHECSESVWTKIPLDEVERHRSSHSSVVSESRNEYKEETICIESKLTRNQKKRLKAKLKTLELKQTEETQCNNSAFVDSSINVEEITDKSTVNGHDKLKSSKGHKKLSNKHKKSASLNSTNSSQISEKIQSFSSIENDDKLLSENFVEEIQPEQLDTSCPLDENMNVFKYHQYVDAFNTSEEKSKLDQEIKEQKEEICSLHLKLKELSSIRPSIISLKAENDTYIKKNEDLERTCNALKKELTSVIQKNLSTENQLVRCKTEINQQRGFYENELMKHTNKINILESDCRTKAVDLDTLKNSIDKMHHLVSDKEKHLQNQNAELSSIKEQLHNKRIDCQDLELQVKNSNLKMHEMDNVNQLSKEEIHKLSTEIEGLKREKTKLQNDFEIFKRQSKAREREQDNIMSSFQYKLDEFVKERQLYLSNNADHANPNAETQVVDKQKISEFKAPSGYELVESSTIARFTSIINDSNKKLQETSDNYNLVIDEYKVKESNLLDQNAKLNEKYSKLNFEFECHLSEIVTLRKSIETLQRELSKNADTNAGEMKIESENKCGLINQSDKKSFHGEKGKRENEQNSLEPNQ